MRLEKKFLEHVQRYRGGGGGQGGSAKIQSRAAFYLLWLLSPLPCPPWQPVTQARCRGSPLLQTPQGARQCHPWGRLYSWWAYRTLNTHCTTHYTLHTDHSTHTAHFMLHIQHRLYIAHSTLMAPYALHTEACTDWTLHPVFPKVTLTLQTLTVSTLPTHPVPKSSPRQHKI